MDNYNLSSREQSSLYKPSLSLPNNQINLNGNDFSFRYQESNQQNSRNVLHKRTPNLINISSNLEQLKRDNSPMCFLNSNNNTISPELMNIRMNFDLLNHKIERLNNLLKESENDNKGHNHMRPNSSSQLNENYSNNPKYLNTITTNSTFDNNTSRTQNSILRTDYSLKLNSSSNRNSSVLNESNDLKTKSLNYTPIPSKDILSVHSINNLLTPPKNKGVDNFTYKNRKFNPNNDDFDDNNYQIKVNIKTITQPNNERIKYKSKLLTEGDISEMINNLHEKTKVFSNFNNDGLDRLRKLRLNQKINNFNKRMITGNWSNIRNSFDIGTNAVSNYLRNYFNNKKYLPTKTPVKDLQLSVMNQNNILNTVKDNPKIKVNKTNFCSTTTCKKCRKNPGKKIFNYDTQFDNKNLMDMDSSQKINNPIQIKDKNIFDVKKNNDKFKNNDINNLIKQYKEKSNENKNLLSSLNIDKPISNFGGLENIKNGNLKENYKEESKNRKQ